MLKSGKSLLVWLMATVLLIGTGNNSVLSFEDPGIADGTIRWRFSYPTNGEEVVGSAAFIGTGPPNAAATLSIFSQENTIAGGVYSSELTLRATRFIDTQIYDVWTSSPYGTAGLWFATVVPRDLVGPIGPNVRPFGSGTVQVGTGGGEDVGNICLSMGGDSVSYRIQDPAAP